MGMHAWTHLFLGGHIKLHHGKICLGNVDMSHILSTSRALDDMLCVEVDDRWMTDMPQSRLTQGDLG